MSAVVETMQELGGHEDFLLAHELCRFAPRTVMLRFEAVTIGPGIEHHALLRVELGKDRLQLVVETALVAVAPKDDRGMIDVAGNHFFDDLRTDDGLMGPVPARLFALYIEAQRVAGIQELWVGRIVREAHGVHVHRLDEPDILYILGLRQRAARLRAEGMAVDALHDYLLPVDEDTILGVAGIAMAILNGAETEALTLYVEGLALAVFQREDGSIEVRRLGSPEPGVLHHKVNLSLVAGNGRGGTGSYFLASRIDEIDDY